MAALVVPSDLRAQSSDAVTLPDIALPPSKGGVRRWEVVAGDVLRATAARDANIIASVSPGDILSNFRCRTEGAVLWCEVRPFRGGARGYVPAAVLVPARGPDGVIAMGRDDSDRRAKRRDFDVRAEIACAQERGQTLGRCNIGIARGTGGDATAVATFANGFARRLTFQHGEFVFADTTMSGTGTDIEWRLEAGIHHLRVDDQRFDIPDALLFGR
ncbi:MAG: hypothetical protein AAFN94_08735 [Pseudomonadota bacterium]